jgi:tetratricopeptide (TPR) repeat protein
MTMPDGPTIPAPAIPEGTAALIDPAAAPMVVETPAARFRVHMRRANALVAEGQLGPAEGEIVSSLVAVPDDLRALKLLALVRFRLGRLAEAGEAYRRVTEAAPDDAAARLNLGLIALKLESFEEAARELAVAVERRPDDKRALGYLAYALARQGQRAEAAVVFRRAGQPDVAAQLEAQLAAEAAAVAAAAAGGQAADATVADEDADRTVVLAAIPPEPGANAEAVAGAGVALASFVLDRMITPESLPAGAPYLATDVLRLAVDGEAMVSAVAVLAVDGDLALGLARRRRRGRETGEVFISGGVPFYRCRGRGELWLSAGRPGGALQAIDLEEDILFLRESLVRGILGPLVWDTGSVPRTALQVMHFHGTGRLLLDWGGADVLAVRLTQPRRLVVPERRLLGWLGGVVAQAALGGEVGASLVACEGEGVLLIARHGESREPVHEPAQSGHDGAGRPDPGDALLHR